MPESSREPAQESTLNEQGPLHRVCRSTRLPRWVGCYTRLSVVLAFGIAGLSLRALPAAEPPSPAEQSKPTPLFSRQIVPILSRLGCNAGGSCHGVVKGQAGFRLSLFGGK